MKLFFNWLASNPRKVTLGAIVLLAGISNMPLYTVQGALLTGHTLDTWSLQFWQIEWGFWGLRSLIEVGVIYYMLVTETENKKSAGALYIFEALAILLILITLGSATVALDNKELLMVESLGPVWSGIVKFGIVGYLPIIIGGAAFAYKIQPDVALANSDDFQQRLETAEQSIVFIEQERDELKQQLARQKSDIKARINEHRLVVLQIIQAVEYLKVMTPFKLVMIMALAWNSHRPENKEIAGLLGLTMPTVIKGVAAAENILPHVAQYLKEEK